MDKVKEKREKILKHEALIKFQLIALHCDEAFLKSMRKANVVK